MAKLYVIGIGPGDPQLITVKAKNVLEQVRYLFFPKGSEEGASLAKTIVGKIVDLSDKNIEELHFPMAKAKDEDTKSKMHKKWRFAAERIVTKLNEGFDTAFLTLGDPALYGTFFYLMPFISEYLPEPDIEIIPGISSISLAFSKLKLPIAQSDERIIILPADSFRETVEVLHLFGTVVILKLAGPDTVKMVLDNRLDFETHYLSRLGMDKERILKIENVENLKELGSDYFSILVLKRRKK
ncbi:MAG: precorrin-2 C(20)-methyltransferase [Deltaproteobacteria bacterium]|nr:precorrin-2 C(20)-methyltransferase [Deltaproteobacteria bacterium]